MYQASYDSRVLPSTMELEFSKIFSMSLFCICQKSGSLICLKNPGICVDILNRSEYNGTCLDISE